MKTPEAREKDKICKYLDSIGAWYFRPYMAGYGKRGVPDIIACVKGKFVAIEVKASLHNEPTPLQRESLLQIGIAGGFANWGTADKIIKWLPVVINWR